ncbi:MAG: hypothetical protein PHT58_07320 [Eubacteriales bacterium]|nr:hypothetical protein [Eubacteriales bacterium]
MEQPKIKKCYCVIPMDSRQCLVANVQKEWAKVRNSKGFDPMKFSETLLRVITEVVNSYSNFGEITLEQYATAEMFNEVIWNYNKKYSQSEERIWQE